MERKFYNKTTVFNPEYRNVQAELWELLNEEQKAVITKTFRHLKNHEQIEISEALLDQIKTGLLPDPRDWSDSFIETCYNYIAARAIISTL